MSEEVLRKLANIFANQNKILKKLAQGANQAESIFLVELEKIKQTPAWQNATHEKRLDFESDLKQAIMALMSEDQEMDSPDDLG